MTTNFPRCKIQEQKLSMSINYLDGMSIIYSVIRLGDFMLFGQAFKAGDNHYFTQIAHIVRQFL